MSMIWRGIDLDELVRAGKTTADIADLAGANTSATRSALGRRGLKPNLPVPETIRNLAEEMPPRDAVEYLLGVLEEALPVVSAQQHEIDTWGVHFTPTQRLLLGSLYEAAPNPVSAGQLYNLLYAARPGDSGPDQNIISTVICHIRRRLPASHGRIVNYFARGYAFEGVKQ
ncbi:helix-turn-helix domain-containing protein [Leisingera sp. M523]|uniref:winged helix-turn-helix domain-containing protein n=1 Tax=Leisingera sp. M523 TaxID=2867013 RepID=UPI0021A93161|nr:helix-turn-helix domain-containing protein [Leisingera sp. M523]UWQ30232.1 helix-turn-helix domain-containing protein [Leisingera sp. M523]